MADVVKKLTAVVELFVTVDVTVPVALVAVPLIKITCVVPVPVQFTPYFIPVITADVNTLNTASIS